MIGEIVFVMILAVLALELLAGFVLYPFLRGKSYYKLILDGHFIYRFDPVLGYSFKPNFVFQMRPDPRPNAPRLYACKDIRTEKHGFLSSEDIGEIKDKLIFCVGGSTTMGSECGHDKTYPAVLDSLVRDSGYRCINAGVGGYRSIHELLLFKNKVLPLNPSAVIIFSGYNDFEDFSYGFYKPYNQFRHSFSHSLPVFQWQGVFFYSALAHISRRLYYRISGKIRTESVGPQVINRLRSAVNNRAWLDEWMNNIGKIIGLCAENKIKCYLLSHASPVYENAPREAKDFAETDLNMCGRFDIFVEYIKIINNAAINLCADNRARYIDVTADFDISDYKKRFSLFVDRMHFTETGNKILAEAIYKKIKSEL